MAPAFTRMMGLVVDKLYDKKEDQIKCMQRHTQFFNTEEAMGAIIPGVNVYLIRRPNPTAGRMPPKTWKISARDSGINAISFGTNSAPK